MDWLTLVDDTRSTQKYTRERVLREHKFKVDCTQEQQFALLRIDVSDQLYLDSLNLVYLGEDGEKSLGEGLGIVTNITKHFLFLSPRSGKYKIQAKGAQYTYSVRALDGKILLPPVIHRIYSPFDVYIGFDKGIELFSKRVMYRAEHEEQFTTVTALFDKKFAHVGGLDGTKTYEFKVQLFIPNLIETKESESIKISNTSSIITKFHPDEFLLNSMLKFVAPDVPPSTCNIGLRVRFPFEDWMQFSPKKARSANNYDMRDIHGGGDDSDDDYDETVYYYGEQFYLVFRLEDQLYDKLDKDTVVEWQLIFQEKSTQRTISGPIVSSLLKKRPKGYESLQRSMHFQNETQDAYFHFGKNGEFQYGDWKHQNCDIKGRFTIESTNIRYLQLMIIPQTSFNQPIYNLNLSGSNSGSNHKIFSVKEVLDIILDYVISTQNDAVHISDIVRLNLVNKEWYDSVRRVLKIRATFFFDEGLVIAHWIVMANKVSDMKIFNSYDRIYDDDDE